MADNISITSTEDPWCDSTSPKIIQFSEVEEAKKTIGTPDGINPSPCIRSKMSDIIGTEIYLKLENLNITGSFKERGAKYALMKLTEEQKQKGVVAASLGNHSQGVSYQGMKLGIPVTVVMPVVAPLMKVNKCKRFKATVISKGNNMSESKKIASSLAKQAGMTYINGYDHPHIIAGQGVIGLEILEQIGTPDAVICPCGGGGLIAGILVVMKEKSPNTEMIGVESEKCPSFSKALEHGRPQEIDCLPSIADGSSVPKVGYNTLATCLGRLDRMVTVSESLINASILSMIEYEKLVVEGSGGSPLAALLSGKLKHLKGKKVVLIISGGNIDTTMLVKVLERASASLGRLIKVSVWVKDRPGGTTELIDNISELGINIRRIYCERAWVLEDLYLAKVTLLCETSGIEHALQLWKYITEKYDKAEFPDFPNVCYARELSTLRMGH